MEKSRLDVNMQDGLKAVADNASGGNYLGDAKVVDQLVRDFFSSVFSTRAQWHETGDGDAAEKRIADLCSSYAKVFLGDSDAYVAQPWNSEHRLGVFLRATVPDVGEYATPGEAYFNFLAVQALNAAIALEEGAMDEESVQAGMTEVVNDAVDVLLGRKGGGVPRG